jgi:RNA polymerase sigma factor (sigma-70 family)
MSAKSDSYTKACSRAIDAAYEIYKSGTDDGETYLYKAFLAQAKNVVAYRLRGNLPELAHDIVYNAMASLSQFNAKSRPSTWFYRIAQNEVNDALFTIVQSRATLVPLLTKEGEVEHEPASKAFEPDYDTKIDLAKLRRVLPPTQADVLLLRERGYTLVEIAESTGKPRQTIASRLRLVRKKAKKSRGK